MDTKEKFHLICIAYVIADKLATCKNQTYEDKMLLKFTDIFFNGLDECLSTYKEAVEYNRSNNLAQLLNQEIPLETPAPRKPRVEERPFQKPVIRQQEDALDIAIGLATTLPANHCEPCVSKELEHQQIQEFNHMMAGFHDCDFNGEC